MRRTLGLALIVAFLVSPSFLIPGEPRPAEGSGVTGGAINRCVVCHSGKEFGEALLAIHAGWARSVHRKGKVTCDSCHGGDPSARTAENAHSYARGFSSLEGVDAAAHCGKCHAGPAARFAAGEHAPKPARPGVRPRPLPTCMSCHWRTHDVRPATSTLVAQAGCAGCHAPRLVGEFRGALVRGESAFAAVAELVWRAERAGAPRSRFRAWRQRALLLEREMARVSHAARVRDVERTAARVEKASVEAARDLEAHHEKVRRTGVGRALLWLGAVCLVACGSLLLALYGKLLRARRMEMS